jgi:Flp pilus assembly protein TadG
MKTIWTAPKNTPVTRTHKGPLRGHVDLRSQLGQALLELALMLPFLLLLTVGGIEVGRYAYLGILVGNAARAGAAYGAQNGGSSTDSPGIVLAAQNDFLQNGQDVSTLTVTSSISCGCDTAGALTVPYTTASACSDATNAALKATISACVPAGHWVAMVSVTASGTFNSLFSYPGFPSSITVAKTATMRVQ